jgi:ATPase family AAA domain-containing protein 3A/B
MQEASALRKEQARRATEQKILEQELQAQTEKAERDRETNKAKAYAEGEARAHAKILSEDVDRQLLVGRMSGEKEKWLTAVNTTFSHIEGFNAPAILDCYQVNLPIPFMTFEMFRQSGNA